MLTYLDNLKQFLKTEVATRKETELHFERMIEKKTSEITEQFNITYINGLNEMRDRLMSFKERMAKMEERNMELKEYVDTELNQ